MHQNQSEIVILKPTPVFLSFLMSQLSENKLPTLQLLQTDNTAYVIRKCDSEEETLKEIEKHFSSMFQHEISRWLGADAQNQITRNFLDFLCCFKFELHSHLIVLEHSLKAGHQLLKIKPRTMLLNWINSTVQDQEELVDIMERVTLSHLAENATLIIKNFSTLKEIKPFLQQYYKPIFDTAMSRISNQSVQWPHINSFHAFNQYFAIEIHTQLVHLH